MTREGQHECVAEGLLSNEEGGVSIWSLDGSNRMTTLAGFRQGKESIEQKGAVRSEAVVEFNHIDSV